MHRAHDACSCALLLPHRPVHHFTSLMQNSPGSRVEGLHFIPSHRCTPPSSVRILIPRPVRNSHPSMSSTAPCASSSESCSSRPHSGHSTSELPSMVLVESSRLCRVPQSVHSVMPH